MHSDELRRLVIELDRRSYRGDCSFAVFNDDYTQLPLPVVAERARRSAAWLAEDELHRAVPLPSGSRLRGSAPPDARAAHACASRLKRRVSSSGPAARASRARR